MSSTIIALRSSGHPSDGAGRPASPLFDRWRWTSTNGAVVLGKLQGRAATLVRFRVAAGGGVDEVEIFADEV